MQILKYILIISLTAVVSRTHGQIAFEKTYGNVQEERGEGIIQLPDSSYIVTGSTSSFGDLSTDLLLLKLDSIGDVIWTKTSGGSNVDNGMEIIATSDSHLAIVGYTNSFGNGGYDVYFLKIDFDGSIVQSRTFGGADWDLGYSIAETNDGGFVITGETYSSGAGSNDAFVLKIDALGDTVWSKTYGGIGNEIGRSIKEAANGDLLLAGETSTTGAGEQDAWLIRMDSNGAIIWEQTFGGTDNDRGADMIELNNGNIMFVWNTIVPGNDYWSTIQSKIDPMTGAVVLQQPFTTPFTYFSHKIIAVQDKPLTLTVGYTAPTSTLDDMMFFGLDTVGMFFDPTCSGITFGGSGIDYGKDILATSDGGFVLVGERNIGVGYTSVFVVKMMADCIGTGTVINDSIFVTQIEAVNDGKLQIYPNPSNGTIKLKSKEKWNKIQLFSLFGNLLEEHEIQHEGIIIESQLTEGTYLLVLTGKNDIHTEKLVIIK